MRFAGLFTWGMAGCWLVIMWLEPEAAATLPGGRPCRPLPGGRGTKL